MASSSLLGPRTLLKPVGTTIIRQRVCLTSRLHRATTLVRAQPDQGEEISDAMKADLERLRARQGQSSSSQEGPLRQPTPSTTGGSSDEGLFASAKETLDKILIADFFLILFILAWLAAGVVQAGLGGGSSFLLDAWYPLWPILWQPALGILMAGALVSGGIGWVAEQQQKR